MKFIIKTLTHMMKHCTHTHTYTENTHNLCFMCVTALVVKTVYLIEHTHRKQVAFVNGFLVSIDSMYSQQQFEYQSIEQMCIHIFSCVLCTICCRSEGLNFDKAMLSFAVGTDMLAWLPLYWSEWKQSAPRLHSVVKADNTILSPVFPGFANVGILVAPLVSF